MSVNVSLSKHLERNKGYWKFEKLEVTAPTLSGFGVRHFDGGRAKGVAPHSERVLLSDEQMIDHVKMVRQAHLVVVSQLDLALKQLSGFKKKRLSSGVGAEKKMTDGKVKK